jgi:hypothetical protein
LDSEEAAESRKKKMITLKEVYERIGDIKELLSTVENVSSEQIKALGTVEKTMQGMLSSNKVQTEMSRYFGKPKETDLGVKEKSAGELIAALRSATDGAEVKKKVDDGVDDEDEENKNDDEEEDKDDDGGEGSEDCDCVQKNEGEEIGTEDEDTNDFDDLYNMYNFGVDDSDDEQQDGSHGSDVGDGNGNDKDDCKEEESVDNNEDDEEEEEGNDDEKEDGEDGEEDESDESDDEGDDEDEKEKSFSGAPMKRKRNP